jgi:hypothetical protein
MSLATVNLSLHLHHLLRPYTLLIQTGINNEAKNDLHSDIKGTLVLLPGLWFISVLEDLLHSNTTCHCHHRTPHLPFRNFTFDYSRKLKIPSGKKETYRYVRGVPVSGEGLMLYMVDVALWKYLSIVSSTSPQ